jgi:hypothetical protein
MSKLHIDKKLEREVHDTSFSFTDSTGSDWCITGAGFKSTGTSQNIVNTLTTNTISQMYDSEDMGIFDKRPELVEIDHEGES